jgi:hypothetical protein
MAAGAPASGRWDVERRLDPAGGPTWANHGSKRRLNQPPDEIKVGGGSYKTAIPPTPPLSSQTVASGYVCTSSQVFITLLFVCLDILENSLKFLEISLEILGNGLENSGR